MANDKSTNAAASAPSQAQSVSAEKDLKAKRAPEKSDEIQFFDTTVTKLVEREVEDEDGKTHTEVVEVMSDNLYPGEKLKRADDEEKAAKKAEEARKDAHRAAEDRKAANK